MPSLFDIGKSGLQAYRQSLAVTGQNIANINTDGYKKREASLEEVTGAGGGVTEISDQTGLGVRVENIKRAFDEFLIDKVRQTSSLYEKTDTFLQEVKDEPRPRFNQFIARVRALNPQVLSSQSPQHPRYSGLLFHL